MAKNLHLRIADQLYLADHDRTAQDLCVGFIDALFSGFNFRYAYPVEHKERDKFIDEFLKIFNSEIKKRRQNELRNRTEDE